MTIRIVSFRGDRFFLSNFYPFVFTYYGKKFPTAEHAYVWEKVPIHKRSEVNMLSKPGEVKRQGYLLGSRKGWSLRKLAIMYSILIAKFSEPTLKYKLVSTGDKELIERNVWHDNYWGSCTCERCNDTGQNHLGKLLMRVREELR